MNDPLIGKKCFLQLEDGRIPAAILKAARQQKFYDFHLLCQKLTLVEIDLINKRIAEILAYEPLGEEENDYETFAFEELPRCHSWIWAMGKRLLFPSRYFQFEVKPNHPLTDFFTK